MGYEESLRGDSDRTAFRKAEKKYKLYKAVRGSVIRGQNVKVPTTDLSDVLDFRKILKCSMESGCTPDGFSVNLDREFAWPVITMAERPGFYFIPGALSLEEQFYWIKQSLITFPQSPNRTNHNAFYGPLHDLWFAAQENKVLVETGNNNPDNEIHSQLTVNSEGSCKSKWVFVQEKDVQHKKLNGVLPRKSIAASSLLRKMRWATLGLQFDWSKRNYDESLPHEKIPASLAHLAKDLARPAMTSGDFSAEAAIVNYFASDDTLGGHLDDMEADWNKPIVSISLGCKAIFLLGGQSREDNPLAMFLQSGDVILMAGPARQCYHGVPRIFTDEEQSDLPNFESLVSDTIDNAVVEYIKNSRININVRQVY